MEAKETTLVIAAKELNIAFDERIIFFFENSYSLHLIINYETSLGVTISNTSYDHTRYNCHILNDL